MTPDLVMAMARQADNPALERRRRSPSAWRIWSDGEVTTDGMTLLQIVDGASGLGLQFPRRAEDGSSYAIVTRRDAIVVHDRIACLAGASWTIRRRALASDGGADQEDRLPWDSLGMLAGAVSSCWSSRTARSPGSAGSAESIADHVDRLREFASLGPDDAAVRAVRGILLSCDLGIAVPVSERELAEQYAYLCTTRLPRSGDPLVGDAIAAVLSSMDRSSYWRSGPATSIATEPESVAVAPVGITPGWRKNPPTVDEVRALSWWWNRTSDGDSHVVQLDIDAGSGAIIDVVEQLANDCGARFDPSDWSDYWAPCLPPPEGPGS